MHSFPPTKIYAIAPKKNIREFPIKNATTVAIVPEFQHFFYMLMDLVTSCTTIVNDAFFK